nr:MAG TPA: hypothetical protein [Caudoviricetes sp.]
MFVLTCQVLKETFFIFLIKKLQKRHLYNIITI